jgi:plasmid stabilization system protein ParE
MPKGDKSAYTEKQKRQAELIEDSYEQRGVGEDEAERRAWATVNKTLGGGKKSGLGRGSGESTQSSKKRGQSGRAPSTSHSRTPTQRAASTRKTARAPTSK